MSELWRDKAKCRDMDVNLFFQDRITSIEAINACLVCPVKEPCLDHALRHEIVGYWGGTTGKERKTIRRKMNIIMQRPEAQKRFIPEVSCGTENGYQAHVRLRRDDSSHQICKACRLAHNRVNRFAKQRKRASNDYFI